jgi:hypothetical protein
VAFILFPMRSSPVEPRSLYFPAIAGVGAFLAVQIFLLASSPASAQTPDHPGWFLNSGDNVRLMALGLSSGAAIAAFLHAGNPIWRALAFSGGAIVAMSAILFYLGPGTIFPIVLVIGSFIVAVAVGAGTAVGALLGYALRAARRAH